MTDIAGLMRVLAENIALLLTLTYIFSHLTRLLQDGHARWHQFVMGLLFGTFGLLSMLFTIQLTPGVLFDARTVPVIIAGAFGGWRAGLTAAAVVAVYRLTLGGVGAVTGAAGIFAAALIGVFFFYRLPVKDRPHRLWMLGFALVASTFFWFALLPSQLSVPVLQTTALPFLLFYPPAVVLLGFLLREQYRLVETQNSLEESERRFRAIFNGTFQFTGLLTPDGTLLEANQTALNFGGFPADAVIGRPFWEAGWWSLSEATKEQLKDAIDRARGGEFVRYEVEVVGSDQRVILIDFSLQPVKDASGKVVLLIPEGRNITDRKLAEQHAVALAIERERVVLLRKFIGNASHDLSTPLTALITSNYLLVKYTERLSEQIASLRSSHHKHSEADTSRALEEITQTAVRIQERIPAFEEHVQRLHKLIEDMLLLTRLDGEFLFEFSLLDLGAVVQQVVDVNAGRAHEHSLDLKFTAAVSPVWVKLDQQQFRLVVQGLIENAIQYTPANGNINVAVLEKDGKAVVEVRDTGVGIEEAKQALVFERFYRGSAAREITTGGSGLGLAIAKRVVEAHGGTIELQSIFGAGSTFRVCLPLHIKDDNPKESCLTFLPTG